MAHVESVNIGQISATESGSMKRTAIDKRPATATVRIHSLGLSGDEIADPKHHGGVDQAVYAFAREDYAHWEADLDRALSGGSFGENLTTVGLDIQGARIGDRWRVGSALLEVSDVRIPCSVFAGFVDEPRWVKRFTEHGVPGAYLRVIEEGEVAAGAAIEVVESRDHDLTVGFAFRAATTQLDRLGDLAAERRLGRSLRTKVEKHLRPT